AFGVIENSISSAYAGFAARPKRQPGQADARCEIIPILVISGGRNAGITRYDEAKGSIRQQFGLHAWTVRDDFVVSVVDSEIRLIPYAKVQSKVRSYFPVVLEKGCKCLKQIVASQCRVLLKIRRQTRQPLSEAIAKPRSTKIKRSAIGVVDFMPVGSACCEFHPNFHRVRTTSNRQCFSKFVSCRHDIEICIATGAEIAGNCA